jgi:integrase
MSKVTPHGKGWRAQVRRKGHRPLSKTFPLKKQAEAWRDIQEAAIVRGELGIRQRHTVGEALKKYREERARNRWETNRILLLEADPIAKLDLGALDSSHLSALRDRELARVNPATGKAREGTTVRRIFSLLASVFKVARADWKWLTHNPFQDFERPAPKKGRARGLEQAEIDATVAALGWVGGAPENASQQVAVAFLLAIETAMRAGEILSLGWEQVFPKKVHLTKTKNGDERDVPLTLRARELLGYMRGIDAAQVFTVAEGSRDKLFRDARVRAGLKGFTFHDSRSEGLSRLSKKPGMDILTLARITGHRDLNSLLIYFRRSMEDVADTLD